mgnify:CR=1 FL=1
MSRLDGADLRDLRYAKSLLERTSLAIRISNLVGMPIERGIEMLPKRASALVTGATRRALQTALRFALVTLDDQPGERSADVFHNVIQIANPSWNTAFCLMPDAAKQTRAGFLARQADNGTLVMPCHFGVPHCGYIRKQADGYRFEPATW